MKKIFIIITLSLLSLSSFAYDCIDFTGEYLSDAYGGVIEEIIQESCDKRTIVVKRIGTEQVILTFHWITDGRMQRNTSSDEVVSGEHREDHFSWSLFNQTNNTVTRAKEFKLASGDILREMVLTDRFGNNRFVSKTLRQLR